MKILIVKTSAIGDVLHTLPALAALRRHFPEARISWLVEEAAADIVLGHPALDQVLVSKRKEWLRDFRAGDWMRVVRAVFAFIRQLRAVEYDLLIDFQGLLKSSMFIALTRARRKVGFGRGMAHAEGSYLFLNERIPAVDMDIHAVKRELLLLEALGVDCQGVDGALPLDAKSHARASELLARVGVDGNRPLIAINPMTTWPTKHWTPPGFAALAEALAQRGMTVVFTGGPGDRAAIDAVLAVMTPGQALNLAGLTDLKTLAALYARCRLLISTDTGPMHLAAAVSTPVVALFGPTAPWRTGPYGGCHQIVRAGLACSPCYKRICPLGTNQCMRDIRVEDVLLAVDKAPC